MVMAAGFVVASAPAMATPQDGLKGIDPRALFEGLKPYLLQRASRGEGIVPQGLLGEDSVDYRPFTLVSVPTAEIDKFMVIADESSPIPAKLQGLWWMDGNPFPDDLVSFGRSLWDPINRRIYIRVYDEAIWTWHDNIAGRITYRGARLNGLVYEVQLSNGDQFAMITPIIQIGLKHYRLPKALTYFTARYIQDGLWLRESWVFGVKANTYNLRRIVRADGTREEAFAEYLKVALPSTLIARRPY
jgi:hypothetical protein